MIITVATIVVVIKVEIIVARIVIIVVMSNHDPVLQDLTNYVVCLSSSR